MKLVRLLIFFLGFNTIISHIKAIDSVRNIHQDTIKKEETEFATNMQQIESQQLRKYNATRTYITSFILLSVGAYYMIYKNETLTVLEKTGACCLNYLMSACFMPNAARSLRQYGCCTRRERELLCSKTYSSLKSYRKQLNYIKQLVNDHEDIDTLIKSFNFLIDEIEIILGYVSYHANNQSIQQLHTLKNSIEAAAHACVENINSTRDYQLLTQQIDILKNVLIEAEDCIQECHIEPNLNSYEQYTL